MLGNTVIKRKRKLKKMRSRQGSESQGRESITKKEGSGQKCYMHSVSIYPKKVIQKKENLFAQRMS